MNRRHSVLRRWLIESPLVVQCLSFLRSIWSWGCSHPSNNDSKPKSPDGDDGEESSFVYEKGPLSNQIVKVKKKSEEPPNPNDSSGPPVVTKPDDTHPLLEGEGFLDGEREEETEEQRQTRLIEEIREKKEVIEKLRSQPWNMHRKIHTLRLAQQYLEKHEAKVSKSHLYKEELSRKWKKLKRWMANVSIYLIPWENKIKKIESHFGSVVSSYFTFVRWIFWVNLMMSLFTILFIVVPEVLADVSATADRREKLRDRKEVTGNHVKTATLLQTMWDFEGAIRTSPLFYGFYGDDENIGYLNYKLPLAYFLVYIVVLGYSFFAILRKMAENARRSKMTASKTEHYSFSWKVFTMWDYTIGNSETAANTVAANNTKLKEAIGEYKARIKETFNCLRLAARILANILIICLISASTWLVYLVVERSHNIPDDAGGFRRNEVPIVVSLITLFFPNIFEVIGKLEQYHPRTSLRFQLARILALYLLNFYTLIFALFKEIKAIEESGDRFSIEGGSVNSSEPLTRVIRSLVGTELEANLTEETLNFFNETTRDLIGSLGSLAAVAGLLVFPNTSSPGSTNTSDTTVTPNFTDLFKLNQDNGQPQDFYSYMDERTGRTARQTNQPTTDKSVTFTEFVPQVGNITFANLRAVINPNVTKEESDKLLTSEVLPVPTTPLPFRPNANTIQPDPRDLYTVDDENSNSNTTRSAQGATPDSPTTASPLVWRVPWKEPDHIKYANTTLAPPQNVTNATEAPAVIPNLLDQQKALHRSSRPKNKCWETYVGQEICRLITMDLVMTVASVMIIDFIRGLVVRFCNPWWCWNLETYFPEYGEFKVAENVLHIVNNQGMIWLGLFFSPVLPAVNNVKLIILLYLRSWACTTCNVPNQQVFRASRSNNFYLMLLLLMLFLCTLPVAFVIASQKPSKSCGPFTDKEYFYHIITDTLKKSLGPSAYKALDYVASPGIVIPFLLLMLLIIYFLVSFSQALKESNEDLKSQLHKERTEEKRKIFAIAGGAREKSEEPTMPAIKKVSTSHLPEVEKKRRETWHPKASYDVHVTLPLYDPNKPDNHQNDRESLTDSEEETSETSPTHRVKRTSRQMTNDINPVAKLSNSYIPALTVVAEEGTALPDILSIDSLPCQSMRHSGDNLEEPKANGFNNNLMDFSHPNSPFPDMRSEESPSSCDTLDDRSELNLSPDVLEKMMKPIERRYFIPEGHSSMEPLLLSTSDSEAGLIPKPLATGMPDQSYNEPVGTFENFGFLQSGSDLDKQKYPANGGGLRQSSFTSWPKSRENVPPAVKAAGRTGKFNFRSTEKNGKLTSTSSSSPSSSNERRPFVRNFTEAVRVIQPDFHSESDGLASPLNSGSQTVDSTDVSMSSTAPLTQNQLLRSSHSAGIQNGNFSSESTV